MKIKSAILQILHGERGYDFIKYKKTEENDRLLEKVDSLYEAIKEKVAPEQLKLIDEMIEAVEDIGLAETDEYYKEGFKLGLLIGMETVNKEE